jgi:hypothetical protein
LIPFRYILEAEILQHGEKLTVYLDRHCLRAGREWKDGFLRGLQHANVIILLMSELGLDRISNLKKDQTDNLLLEYPFRKLPIL